MTNKCLRTHNHLAIVTADARVLPCCQYILGEHEVIHHIDSESEQKGLTKFLNNNEWKSLRNSLENGERPEQCSMCWFAEDADRTSSRKYYNEDAMSKTDVVSGTIQSLEIGLDFTCNMMCRHCKPAQSSKWNAATPVLEQMKTIYGESWHYPYNPVGSPVEYQSKMRNTLDSTDLSKLVEVRLVGGEPFYSKHFPWFIDKLNSEVDKSNLWFAVNTNGSIIPSDKELDFILNTRKSSIDISIDAVGDLASCIRHGVDWSIIKDNILKWKELAKTHGNLKLSLHPTVSILNVNRLQEIIDFADELELLVSFHELNTPEFYNHKQLPVNVREKWLVNSEFQQPRIIKDLNNCITASEIGYNMLDKFDSATNVLNDYQKHMFQDVNKEMWDVIETHKEKQNA